MDNRRIDIDGVTVFKPSGRLGAAEAPDFAAEVDAVLHSSRRLVIDLSQVTYASSGALRVILGAAQRLDRRGCGFAVCCLPPEVGNLLETAGFANIVDIHDEGWSAIRAVKSAT